MTGEQEASGLLLEEARACYGQPLPDLIFQAQRVHRQHFAADELQLSTLLNIKSGGCSEDCAYCPQSAHHATGLANGTLLGVAPVVQAARAARAAGASRFCMGAAWRAPTDRDVDALCNLVEAVRAEGLETCLTVGMLTAPQAERLSQAGLDYYNHNLDTSRAHYGRIVSTRDYQDRLDTLQAVGEAGMRICSGGILGMGETVEDRLSMLCTLATLPVPPESVPINLLVPVPGTPLEQSAPVDIFDLVRTIATARILLPKARVRLSAGRRELSDEAQALCFMAGANSLFYGDFLLTTENPATTDDQRLFERLGMRAV
ncbi:MAG TPA: biotin synthase BioB [Gammaproteobacteria bacterium]|nr:biotin synthase BioB [Gammaproteobacteria bacterium]